MMSLLFGNLTENFVGFGVVLEHLQDGDLSAAAALPAAAADFRNGAAKNAGWLCLLGLGMMVCTFVYMYIWVYTGEVNAKRIREKYLQAVLRQDIQYFDKVGAGEVTTRIQTDTRECSCTKHISTPSRTF